MAIDPAIYAAGVILPGPTALPGSTQAMTYDSAGVFAGWASIASGGSPGGSGTELQYRAGASTFGAVVGSSYATGGIALVCQNATTIGVKVTGATSHSVALLQLNMGATPSGNAVELNSSGGSGGDVARLTTGGVFFCGAFKANMGGGVLLGQYLNNFNDYWTAFYLPPSVNQSVFSPDVDGLFCFRGQTSSFPAMKRSGAAVAFRLADDSADCAISCASITLANAANIVVNATTGSKIGTATGQKIGFWNATPSTQPTTIVDADGTLADITTKFNSLLSKLETIGLLASA